MRKLIYYFILILFILFVVGFLLTSYRASLALVLGILLAWLVEVIFNTIPSSTFRFFGYIILLLIALITAIIIFIRFCIDVIPPVENPSVVDEYQVTIEYLESETFIVEESAVVVDGLFIDFPTRLLKSNNRSLLLKELQITPLQMDTLGDVNVTMPDGDIRAGPLCGDYCPESTVELVDFPINRFYAARGAQDIERFSYINTETIVWSVRNLEKGVAFAYFRSPYHYYLRPILQPFLGITSIGQWAIGFISLVSTILLAPIVRPVFIDAAQAKLKSIFGNKEQPKETARFIISGKGDEKEVEIEK